MNASEIKILLRGLKPIAGAASRLPVIDAHDRACAEPFCRPDRQEPTPGSEIENRFIAAPAHHPEHALADVELAPKRVCKHGRANAEAETPQGEQGRPDKRYVKIPDVKPRQEKPCEDRGDPYRKKQPHSPG
jgi:hypothetical protein